MVVLVNVWLIELWAVDSATSPLTLTLSTTVHVYVVFVGTIWVGALFVSGTVKVSPLQIVAVLSLITGFGFTVTVTVKVVPKQVPESPEVGVTV